LVEITITNEMIKNLLCQQKSALGNVRISCYLATTQVKVSCIIIQSNITFILSRVGYVVLTFCPENPTDRAYGPENQTDGSYSLSLTFSVVIWAKIIAVIATPGPKESHTTCYNYRRKRQGLDDPAFDF